MRAVTSAPAPSGLLRRSKVEVNYNEQAFFKAADAALQVERQRRM